MIFNFYNKLLVTITSPNNKNYENYFVNEYDRISLKSKTNEDTPAIQVYICKNLPNPEENDISNKIKVKNLFTFRYLIRGTNRKKTEIYFEEHWIDKLYINAIAVFLQSQILEPLMYMKLLQQRILLLHAAGVTKDNNAYILPAHGGTGKTSLSIKLLQHDFRLLGDDLIFINVDLAEAFPYPRPLHLFTYNLNSFQKVNLPSRFYFYIRFKNIIRFFLEKAFKDQFLISTRVHADQLLKDPFGGSGKIKKINFLTKRGDFINSVDLDDSAIYDVASTIIQSADLNTSLYYLLPETEAQAVRDLEISLTYSLVKKVGRFSFVNTRKISDDNITEFINNCLTPG